VIQINKNLPAQKIKFEIKVKPAINSKISINEIKNNLCKLLKQEIFWIENQQKAIKQKV
jgi:hypothetical protein